MAPDPDRRDELDRIERARGGDCAAIGELWRAHRGWLAAVLLVHRPAGADLDDLLQDVAVALVARIGELQSPHSLRAWLRTIAINTARSAGRRVSARPVPHSLQAFDGEPCDPSTEQRRQADEVRERVAAVLRVVEQLPLEYREPLVLRAVHGMTQRAIADALGLSEAAVETRLARARRLLRRDFGAPPVSRCEPRRRTAR